MSIITKQHKVRTVQERSYGNLPTTLLDNAFSLDVITPGRVNETPTYVNVASGGRRIARRRVTTAKAFDWTLTVELMPEQMGWFWKWGYGKIVDLGDGHYRIFPADINQQLPSFALAVDTNKPDHYGAGEQTGLAMGCVIGSMNITGTAEGEGRLFNVEMSGIAKQPLVSTSGIIVVQDYTALSGKTITVVVNGVESVLTEGVDWTAETSNTVTATNIETAIDGVIGISGSSATATATVTNEDGYTLSECRTNADPEHMTAQPLVGDVLQGLQSQPYSLDRLYNDAEETPYLFQMLVPQIDGGGYDPAVNWQGFTMTITNDLAPRTYAKGSNSPFIDNVYLRTQMITVSFTKDLVDAQSDVDKWRAGTSQAIDVDLRHPKARNAANKSYRTILHFTDLLLTDANPIFGDFGEGDDIVTREIAAQAYIASRTTAASNANANPTEATLDVDVAYVAGVSGKAEAYKFPAGSTGFLTSLKLRFASDDDGNADDIHVDVYSNNAGVPGSLLTGGDATQFQGDILSTTLQDVIIHFANRPLIENGTEYWMVIYGEGVADTLILATDNAGTASHSVTTDGGQTWAVADTEDAIYEVYVDDIAAYIDLYVESAGEYADSV